LEKEGCTMTPKEKEKLLRDEIKSMSERIDKILELLTKGAKSVKGKK